MKSAEVPSPDPIPTEKRDKNYKFGYKNCKEFKILTISQHLQSKMPLTGCKKEGKIKYRLT